LALSCTAEFTTLKGGTIPLVYHKQHFDCCEWYLNKEVAVNLVMINNTSCFIQMPQLIPHYTTANALNIIAIVLLRVVIAPQLG
jgi:hypothetical protein